MSAGRVVTITVVALIALIVLSNSLYVVDMTQQVVVTQFGRPIGQAITTPGLRIKAPFVQKANVFDKRVLEWDGTPSRSRRRTRSTSGWTRSPGGASLILCGSCSR